MWVYHNISFLSAAKFRRQPISLLALASVGELVVFVRQSLVLSLASIGSLDALLQRLLSMDIQESTKHKVPVAFL